jgi:hypothetical protein
MADSRSTSAAEDAPLFSAYSDETVHLRPVHLGCIPEKWSPAVDQSSPAGPTARSPGRKPRGGCRGFHLIRSKTPMARTSPPRMVDRGKMGPFVHASRPCGGSFARGLRPGLRAVGPCGAQDVRHFSGMRPLVGFPGIGGREPPEYAFSLLTSPLGGPRRAPQRPWSLLGGTGLPPPSKVERPPARYWNATPGHCGTPAAGAQSRAPQLENFFSVQNTKRSLRRDISS